MDPESGVRLRSRETAIAVLVLGLILVTAFFDVVFLGATLRASNSLPAALPEGHWNDGSERPRWMSMYDNTPAVLEEPYLELKRRAFDAGVLPLWNPHQAGGTPFLATMESSLFYALDAALLVVRGPWAWDLYYLLRLWLAGLFTWLFAREIGLRRLAALCAGAAFMLSGPLVSWVANVTTSADLLLPLLLFLVERTLRRRSPWAVVALALAVFQTVAAGHPEHTFFVLLATLLYALVRLWFGRGTVDTASTLGRWTVGALAGLGLAAFLVLPFVEYLDGNSWHIHSPDVGLESLGLDEMPSLLFPWWDSSELVSYDGWVRHTWPGGWLGLLPVWFVLAVAVSRPLDRRAVPLLAVLLFFLLKIFGLPPLQWLGHLPVFDVVKYPLHATQIVGFATAVLAAMAIDRLSTDRRASRSLGRAGAVVAAIGFVLLLLDPPHNSGLAVFGLASLLALAVCGTLLLERSGRFSPAVAAALLGLCLVTELLLLIPRERPRRGVPWQKPPYVAFLEQDPTPHRVYGIGGALYPNSASAFGLDDLGLYEGLFVDRFASFVHRLVDRAQFGPDSFHALRSTLANPANPFLDLLNLKYLVMARDSEPNRDLLEPLGLRVVYDDEVIVLERLRALPRARILGSARYVQTGEEALTELARGFDFRDGVVLERSEPLPAPARTADPRLSRVVSSELSWNRKRFVVELDAPGYLVVHDVHYPGWRAIDDGAEVEILRADYLFQAVALGPGRHEITMLFRPRSLLVGLWISGCSLAALLGWAIVKSFRMRRRP